MLYLVLVLLTYTLLQPADTTAALNNADISDTNGENRSEPHSLRQQSDSLIDAVSGLGSQVVNFAKNCIAYYDPKQKGHACPPQLNFHDCAAIKLYTMDYLHEEMNGYLRQNTGEGIYEAYIDILLHSLSKLPVHRGLLWRGDVYEYEKQCRVGNTLIWRAFTSTSTDRTVAKRFGRLYKIPNGQGYDIAAFSDFPREKEVLLMPNMRFKVIRKEDGKPSYCEIQQLTPPNIQCSSRARRSTSRSIECTSGGTLQAGQYFPLAFTAILHVTVTMNWYI